MYRTPRYTEINVIDNYAPTAKADVTIVDADGKPVLMPKWNSRCITMPNFIP